MRRPYGAPYGLSNNFGSKAMVSGLRRMLGFAWLHRMKLLRWTRRSLGGLLTCDRRLWGEARLPIADVPGVIVLDIDAERPVQALDVLRLVTKTFVRTYDVERWRGMKVLASAAGCTVKMLDPDGSISRCTIRDEAGLLFVDRSQPAEGVYEPSRAGRADKVPA